MIRLYLDNCCLNRPFDDQSQDRIRLESEAVLSILAHVDVGKWQWVASDVLFYEVARTPDVVRQERLLRLARSVSESLGWTRIDEHRAEFLKSRGFKAVDALHLAAAESSACDVFLTTDDQLLRVARKMSKELRVRVENPIAWLQEVLAT